jgi:DNA-binding NtrC family response regulator
LLLTEQLDQHWCVMAEVRFIAIDDPDPLRRVRLARVLTACSLPVMTNADIAPTVVVVVAGAGALQDETRQRLSHMRHRWPQAVLIFLAHDAGEAAMAQPFADVVLLDGLNPAVLVPAVSMACGSGRPRAGAAATPPPSELVGESHAMRHLRATIAELAPSTATVLLLGETGSGKECAARMLHRLSGRATQPLVALNCAAVPDALLEGELFGYERGAFTGAVRAFPGKLKLADKGSLFLDEIGDLSGVAQAKILRAIEAREVHRLGAHKPESFDARIITATNVNLAARMDEGTFRADLYYRLAVAVIELPPLRHRREDIPALADHALARLSKADGHPAKQFSQEALYRLCAHEWPGNVRELMNVVEVARLRSTGMSISAEALPLRQIMSLRPVPSVRPGLPASMRGERERILDALQASRGNKSMAALRLSWSRMTLYRKLEQHQISPS